MKIGTIDRIHLFASLTVILFGTASSSIANDQIRSFKGHISVVGGEMSELGFLFRGCEILVNTEATGKTHVTLKIDSNGESEPISQIVYFQKDEKSSAKGPEPEEIFSQTIRNEATETDIVLENNLSIQGQQAELTLATFSSINGSEKSSLYMHSLVTCTALEKK